MPYELVFDPDDIEYQVEEIKQPNGNKCTIIKPDIEKTRPRFKVDLKTGRLYPLDIENYNGIGNLVKEINGMG